jgi:hypothetical protein
MSIQALADFQSPAVGTYGAEMPDEIDMANDLADLALNIALRNVSAGQKIAPKGACYFCEAKVEGQQLFCDADCAGDYEHEQKRKNRR